VHFFLDRGLGSRIVPDALRQAGWTLETMDERHGKTQSQQVKDTQWIEEATMAGDVLLCKDLAVAHNPLEAQVIYMSSARVFGRAVRASAAVCGRCMGRPRAGGAAAGQLTSQDVQR
jgi:hypothetical protein